MSDGTADERIAAARRPRWGYLWLLILLSAPTCVQVGGDSFRTEVEDVLVSDEHAAVRPQLVAARVQPLQAHVEAVADGVEPAHVAAPVGGGCDLGLDLVAAGVGDREVDRRVVREAVEEVHALRLARLAVDVRLAELARGAMDGRGPENLSACRSTRSRCSLKLGAPSR